MKFILAFCFLIGFAFGQQQNNNNQCNNDLNNFLSCVKNSISDNDRQKRESEWENQKNQCFQQQGCDPPNWNENPNLMKDGHSGYTMPEPVKQCLKQKIAGTVGSRLTGCLARHNIYNVDWHPFTDNADGGLGRSGPLGDVHAGMLAMFNAVKAVDKCCQTKKGGDTNAMKSLEQCLQQAKQEIRPKVCASLRPCEDKVSSPCKDRVQEIRKAVCLCKKERELEIAGKMRTLSQQPKITFQDLMKTATDNDQDTNTMMNEIEQCYQETNTPEPDSLKKGFALIRSGGGPRYHAQVAATLSINPSEPMIMSDMLTLEANDKSECDSCDN